MLNNPKTKNILLVGLLILAIGFVAFAYYYSQVAPVTAPKTPQPSPQNSAVTPKQTVNETFVPPQITAAPTATATPRPLPHGKRSFVVSLPANAVGPKMGAGTIDPYDPGLNTKQTVTIEVNDTVPVQKVVASLKTDNKTAEYPLQPATPGQSKGNWTGTWTVDDTINNTYTLTIKATSSKGTTMADITTR